MEYPIYFVSDNHFMDADDAYEKKRRKDFFSLLTKIKGQGGTLVICGDFLDFWYDYGDYIPENYKNIFSALEDLSKGGTEIHYVLGNHDYWDFGLFSKTFNARVHKKKLVLDLDGERTLVVHGDGVLESEWFYRFFRKIIRHRAVVYLFGLIPPRIGYFIASLISNTKKHKSPRSNKESLVAGLKRYSAKEWEKGFDNVLIGHYHQRGIHPEKDKKVIFLGDWLSKFLVTEYSPGQWKQSSWTNSQ